MEQSINLHGIQLLEHRFTDLDYANDVTIMEESLSNPAKSLGQLQMDASHLEILISRTETKLRNFGSVTDVHNIFVLAQESKHPPLHLLRRHPELQWKAHH